MTMAKPKRHHVKFVAEKTIKEPTKVAELGMRAYEAFYGGDVSSHRENLELLPVFAHLLLHLHVHVLGGKVRSLG